MSNVHNIDYCKSKENLKRTLIHYMVVCANKMGYPGFEEEQKNKKEEERDRDTLRLDRSVFSLR